MGPNKNSNAVGIWNIMIVYSRSKFDCQMLQSYKKNFQLLHRMLDLRLSVIFLLLKEIGGWD